MFGERPIVGQTIIRIKKDRIKLPDFTHVEVGDEVSATFDLSQKKIILMQEKELIERLNDLNKKLELAYTNGVFDGREYRRFHMYVWGLLPLHDRIINSKLEYQLFNRRPVARYELRQLQELYLRDEVFAVGVGTTLELYPSEEAYHEYQRFEEEQRVKSLRRSG